MPPIKLNAIGHPIRLLPEWRHDPYQNYRKWPDPTSCPDCGVIYKKGRWCWPEKGEEGEKIRCPACQRTKDGNPAGYLTLYGIFFEHHRDEINQLIDHIITREKTEHPMKRLIARIQNSDGKWLYTFTEPHLTAQIGDQLKRAYDGHLETNYEDAAYEVRVEWSRND